MAIDFIVVPFLDDSMIPFLNESFCSIQKAKVTAIAHLDNKGVLHTAENPDATNLVFIVKARINESSRFFATDGDEYIMITGRNEKLGIDRKFEIEHPRVRLTIKDQHIFKSAIKEFMGTL